MIRKKMIGVGVVMAVVIGLFIATGVTAAQKMAPETIQGVVEKGEKGIMMIKTDEGEMFTILGKNMTEMVGKTVKVTGTLTKGAKNRSMVVMQVEEIKE